MEDKTIGILGGLLILTLFGGGLYLTQDEIDNTYFCTATEEVGIFYGGISGTGLTAYPYKENRTDYERCKFNGINGVWILLEDYMKEMNITSFVDNTPKDYPYSLEIKYLCNPIRCVRIN